MFTFFCYIFSFLTFFMYICAMEIKSKLLKEITAYCELNNIKDIEAEVNRLLLNGFNIERYGLSPFTYTIPQAVENKPSESEKTDKPKRTYVRKKKEQVQQEVETKEEEIKEQPIKRRNVKIIKK